ncbi:exopolysaccharide biosynthesis protein [filamentous cyanobacterium CCP1]|nr:exopolysaccharide biosynthesis protein [filamentous cyanobacterium CCP2]PSB68406.1 exopolysaccharide biosynthesis protein [filamentous cyanobacterium CCP1]
MHLRFSQDIKTLLEKLAQQPLTLEDVLAETSERGFSLVIGLLVLPFLFPMPPGFSTILGSGCLLLSLQMAIGRRSPWLPKRVARFQFPRQFILQLLQNLNRVTRLLEKIARPRWMRLTANPHIWQMSGVCIAWLTVLLMAPIPFTNPIPTVGILLFAVATLEADGLLLCLSFGLTVAITLIFGLIGYLLWQSPQLLQNLPQNLSL